MGKQLTLDLGHRPALGRDDYLVTEANAAAVALVDQWPHWPAHAAVIVGPAGSGKSHLGEVWRQVARAESIAAPKLQMEEVPLLMATGALVVEDLDDADLPENAVFHLLNFSRQNAGYVLFTARHWPLTTIRLPDLASRFNALPVATIQPPDDELLRGVLVKLFNDRQIAVDEPLVSYLLARMPRSLDMARQLVERIDHAALEQGSEVTRSFAGKILAEMENPDLL